MEETQRLRKCADTGLSFGDSICKLKELLSNEDSETARSLALEMLRGLGKLQNCGVQLKAPSGIARTRARISSILESIDEGDFQRAMLDTRTLEKEPPTRREV